MSADHKSLSNLARSLSTHSEWASPVRLTLADENSARLLSPWVCEHAARVHRVCGYIQRSRDSGQKLIESIKRVARFYLDRYYHCDPARPIRLRPGTLIRFYYLWKKSGRTPEAVTLRYKPSPRKLDPALLSRFVDACLPPGVCSFNSAHRSIGDSTLTLSGCYHALPDRIKKPLADLFIKRRRARFFEARARRAINAALPQPGGQV